MYQRTSQKNYSEYQHHGRYAPSGHYALISQRYTMNIQRLYVVQINRAFEMSMPGALKWAPMTWSTSQFQYLLTVLVTRKIWNGTFGYNYNIRNERSMQLRRVDLTPTTSLPTGANV